MAVGMAVATMGRDDAAAGEECAGSDELPDEAWREITVAEGSQGPRSYMFSAQRVRVTRKGKPGEGAWAVYRRNLDGSEPRYYLSNAPEDTMLETLAYVGGSRWRIESEFETERGSEFAPHDPHHCFDRYGAVPPIAELFAGMAS